MQYTMPFCQRWRNRRDSYVPAREVVSTSHLDIERVGRDRDVADFIAEHHYLGTMPVVRRRFALYERGERVGVALFGQPVNDLAITNVLPGAAAESLELQRLCLLDAVGANAESYFVARCHDMLRREGFVGVVSFSDPEPRVVFRERAEGGEPERIVLRPGHLGTVYQALGFAYLGRSDPKSLDVFVGPGADGRDGMVLNKRTAQKIRSGERGWTGAARLLVERGAPPPPGEREARIRWLEEWRARLTRRVRHRGVHKYVIALDRRARKRVGESLAYPKWVPNADALTVAG